MLRGEREPKEQTGGVKEKVLFVADKLALVAKVGGIAVAAGGYIDGGSAGEILKNAGWDAFGVGLGYEIIKRVLFTPNEAENADVVKSGPPTRATILYENVRSRLPRRS